MEDDEVKKFIVAYRARYEDSDPYVYTAEHYVCCECGYGFTALKQILELAKELKS